MERENPSGTLILPDYLIDEPGGHPKQRWGVRVVDDRVDAVDSHQKLLSRYPDDDRWYARQQVLSPGFVDAHTHLTGLLAHGIPHPPDLNDRTFLSHFWGPRFVERLDLAMVEAAVSSGIFYTLRSGVTTLGDGIEAPQTLPGILVRLAALYRDWGVRARLTYIASSRRGLDGGSLGMAENQTFVQVLRSNPGFSLLRGMVAVDGTTPAVASLRAQAEEAATQAALPLLFHDLEAEQRIRLGDSPSGRRGRIFTPLAEYRFFDRRPPMFTVDVNGESALGLGSDGALFDFFRVMRSAQRQSRDPRRGGRPARAATIWQMATLGGAQALGFEKVGKLAPGWQADLQLIDLTFPAPVTPQNLYDQLLRYGGPEHVQAVLIAGVMRVCGGVVLDVDVVSVREQAHAAARRLWGVGGGD